MHPRLQAEPRVVERGVGFCEVDDDIGVAEHVLERCPKTRVGASDERHVVGGLDGMADGLPHPAGGAGDGDVDHAAAARAGLTDSRALRKRSSSDPTAAADSRSG